jgi:hypothetical protein
MRIRDSCKEVGTLVNHFYKYRACSRLHPVQSLRLEATYQPYMRQLARAQGKQVRVRAPSQTAQRLLDQDLPVSIGTLLPKPGNMSKNRSMSVYITLYEKNIPSK